MLDAEQRLLNATRTPTAGGLAGAAVAAGLDGSRRSPARGWTRASGIWSPAFACDTRLLLARGVEGLAELGDVAVGTVGQDDSAQAVGPGPLQQR